MRSVFRVAVVASALLAGGCDTVSSLLSYDQAAPPAASATVATAPVPPPPDASDRFCRKLAVDRALMDGRLNLEPGSTSNADAVYRQCMMPLTDPTIETWYSG